MDGWIAVDLDGTLAEYHGWQGPEHIGKPIPVMVSRVKQWLAEGRDVRIFTARAWHPYYTEFGHRHPEFSAPKAQQAVQESARVRVRIEDWCKEHIGGVLPITCHKDYGMIELWDDRAVQVIANTGEPIAGSPRE